MSFLTARNLWSIRFLMTAKVMLMEWGRSWAFLRSSKAATIMSTSMVLTRARSVSPTPSR